MNANSIVATPIAAIVLSIAALSALNAQAAVQAGVAGAVRGEVLQFASLPAQPAGQQSVGRNVSSGDRIFLDDEIETGPDAGLQIMLLDETIFTIGPNSRMVIDRFVYDPGTQRGYVTASILKGAFKFVSGQISKSNPADVDLKVGVATMGIRGTSVAGFVSPAGTGGQPARVDVVLLGPGADNNADARIGRIILTNANRSVEISRPGFGTSVIGEDGTPTPPVRMVIEQLDALATRLPSNAGNEDAAGTPNGGGGNVDQLSGQTTGAAATTSVQASQLGGITEQASEIVQAAAEQTATTLATITTFQDLGLVETGTASFTMNDIPLVYKSGPTSNSGGSYDARFVVDFGKRTLGTTVNDVHYHFGGSRRSFTFSDTTVYPPASGVTTTFIASDRDPGSIVVIGDGVPVPNPDKVEISYELQNDVQTSRIADAARIDVSITSATDGTVIEGGRTAQRD